MGDEYYEIEDPVRATDGLLADDENRSRKRKNKNKKSKGKKSRKKDKHKDREKSKDKSKKRNKRGKKKRNKKMDDGDDDEDRFEDEGGRSNKMGNAVYDDGAGAGPNDGYGGGDRYDNTHDHNHNSNHNNNHNNAYSTHPDSNTFGVDSPKALAQGPKPNPVIQRHGLLNPYLYGLAIAIFIETIIVLLVYYLPLDTTTVLSLLVWGLISFTLVLGFWHPEHTRLFACLLLISSCMGMTGGLIAAGYLEDYWNYSANAYAFDVSPSSPPSEFTENGIFFIAFDGTTLTKDDLVGLASVGGSSLSVSCVAPLIPAVREPLTSVNYWSVSDDCCELVVEEGQEKVKTTCPSFKAVPGNSDYTNGEILEDQDKNAYAEAVKDAENRYGITSHEDAVLLRMLTQEEYDDNESDRETSAILWLVLTPLLWPVSLMPAYVIAYILQTYLGVELKYSLSLAVEKPHVDAGSSDSDGASNNGDGEDGWGEGEGGGGDEYFDDYEGNNMEEGLLDQEFDEYLDQE